MRISVRHTVGGWARLRKAIVLLASTLALSGCGVESGNEFLALPENIADSAGEPSAQPQPLGEIPDRTLADITVRGRPYIDQSLGYNVIRSDLGTALRGVSLSFDGGDPYGSLPANLPTTDQLNKIVHDYGFNTLHVYLEGDAEENPHPVGLNEALADQLVALTREAKMYLIITIGNNGENGQIHSMEKSLAFWNLYGAKYKDETHVIYEAHNEPVAGPNGNWTSADWDKQAQMYQTIRNVAPDTMVLLGSFMSFFGGKQAIDGANDLAAQFPGIWDNAGFAFHAYWALAEVENTILAFETSTDYPALLCTEFFPGDTKNDFNEVFESHHIGWTQFEWLAANDLELDRFKGYLDIAGTVWRPDSPDAVWPAKGSPVVPFDQAVGLYSRADEAFLRLNEAFQVIADDRNYDGVSDAGGVGSDEFMVIDSGDDGSVALRGANGLYLTVSGEGQPMVATAAKIGEQQKFKWLELPTGDIALRPWAGSAHLVGTLPATAGADYGLTGSVGVGVTRNGASTYRVATAYTNAIAPLEPLPEIPPGPFFGEPMPVPTDGGAAHPLDSLAPSGRLWASDYDYGGEGVAYHDSGKINLGEAYRAGEAVDVESSSEGYTSVGFFEEDEWLQYSIDVATAGNYILTFRTASVGGGSISFESDCVKLSGAVSTPDTGSWSVWQDQSIDITLKEGVQALRVVSGGNLNLMNMDIRLGGAGSSENGAGCEWTPSEPDDVRVEAEEWDAVITAPEGAVAIAPSIDSDLSNYVGDFDAGDFIEYAVDVPATGCYTAEYRIASQPGSSGFELRFGGVLADSFTVMPTGGWSTWVTFNSVVELTAGPQTLRLDALGPSFNLNWMAFNQTDPEDCVDDGSLTIEAESFALSVQLPDGEIGTQATSDEGGGLNVGWIDAGDWMEYALAVPATANYQVTYRIASQTGSTQGVNLLIDSSLVDAVAVPNTGGWQTWQGLAGGVIALEAGDYVARVSAPNGGFNLNWFKLTPTTETPVGNIGTGSDATLDVGESVTFDDALIDYRLVDFAGNVSAISPDPDDNTNRVVATIKGADPTAATTLARGVITYPLDASLTRLSVRVLAPAAGVPIRMRLEESTNAANRVDVEVLTTVSNAWETLIFDFGAEASGSAALNLNDALDTLSLLFDFGSVGSAETYYWDDITFLDVYVAPVTLTLEMLVGDWNLLPAYGAIGVGPTSGSTSNWVSDGDAVTTRACLFDDVFRFTDDGIFVNVMGDQTWLEPWQGVATEGCGNPVAPHDGNGMSSYAYDATTQTITLTGVGAHLGIPKVVANANELNDPAAAPDANTYRVTTNTEDSMTVEVAYTGGYWSFKLVRAGTTETPDGDGGTDEAGLRFLVSTVADGMLEARGTAVGNTPEAATGIVNPAPGSSLSFHGDNVSGNEAWKLNVGEWYGGSDGNFGMTVGMMVFQLPNFGAVDNPFTSAEFEVTLDQKSTNLDFPADLWAVRASGMDVLQLSDWFVGSSSSAPAEAGTLIQSNYLTPASPLGAVVTSSDANSVLLDYLNARYDGGSGAGDYVFFRVNRADADAFLYDWNAYVLKSSQAEEGEQLAPKITYRSNVLPTTGGTPDPDPAPPGVEVGGNLLTNGTFDDDAGWTAISLYGVDVEGNGVVTIAGGVATFSETVSGPWTKHMALYTTVDLQPGTYQFDMDMTFSDIQGVFGEVYIGTQEPIEYAGDYNGDQRVMVAFHMSTCPDLVTYSGRATEASCEAVASPGRFQITAAGTYYLLFRSGFDTFGTSGIVLDNITLRAYQ